jgi:hypothetical protein
VKILFTAEAPRTRSRTEFILGSAISVVVRKNRRPPFDQAQDERLVTLITNHAIPFVLRLSKHELIFSHDLRLCGKKTGNSPRDLLKDLCEAV